ncbi:hypothetical protein HT746_25025 [Burkholderia pyrrocinia]|uniref:hypothetical protein n=1 Tax=Burkholderia pyrrocinia TaxID=60550 RepID=UPI001576DF97|nr:hypothetical protein [Burkholderia pyrrocinia]NTX30340.1 hypothetical protein [Burkholderia pyrrocinia]
MELQLDSVGKARSTRVLAFRFWAAPSDHFFSASIPLVAQTGVGHCSAIDRVGDGVQMVGHYSVLASNLVAIVRFERR